VGGLLNLIGSIWFLCGAALPDFFIGRAARKDHAA
jgi:hypothetical protein